ncbi:MAG: glycosyltransferase family 1 protein [Deltaproteobacteria bacterium]
MLQDRPGGVGVYIDQICSRILRLNPDTVIYTGTPDVRRAWLEGTEVKGIGARLLPASTVGAGARRRARRLLWLASEVAFQLPRDRVDVLFSPVQEGPLVGGVPSCVVVHDLTALKYPDAYDRLTVAQTRWLLPLMLKHAREVVAVSQNTRRDVIQTFGLAPERVSVVGEGYDGAVFRPRDALEVAEVRARYGLGGRYLLYAGTFSRHKNLGVIVEAMARLPESAGDVVLALVGPTDAGHYAELEATVRRLGLNNRVKVLGYVSRDSLAALMSEAAAFVYPSRYEGFGLAPLEAMACGAPVLVSNVASLPEVVGLGGTLVTGETPEAWGRAIERVLMVDRSSVRRGALEQAARYQWDDAAAALLDVLRRATRV